MTGELLRDPPMLALRRLRQQVPPYPRQTLARLVAAVDPRALHLVQLRNQPRGREEHGRLDAWDALGDVQPLRRPLQPGLQVLALHVGEMQRVTQRQRAPGGLLVEAPRVAVVDHVAGVALELDQVEAARYRDQQIALADAAGCGGERERRPGAVRLSFGQQPLDVIKPVLFPLVGRWPLLEPALLLRWRYGLRCRSSATRQRGHPFPADQLLAAIVVAPPGRRCACRPRSANVRNVL